MITVTLTNAQANILHTAMLAGYYDLNPKAANRDEMVEMSEAINEFYSQLCNAEGYSPADVESAAREYVDDMDGDHASALASAGFGTDEDYGGPAEDAYLDQSWEDRFELPECEY